MATYSKAYQTVTAGRVREDEVTFFKDNKSAFPTGTFTTSRVGGSVQQPVITKEYLKMEEAGKIRSTNPYIAEAYIAGSNNSIK